MECEEVRCAALQTIDVLDKRIVEEQVVIL